MTQARRGVSGGLAAAIGVVVVGAALFGVSVAWSAYRSISEGREEGAQEQASGDGVWSWESVESDIGWTESVAASEGVLYALSTAPGRFAGFGTPDKAIYASHDGLDWSPSVLEDPWVVSIAASDGVLYAVGTAPGVTEPSEFRTQLGTSADEGVTWSYTELAEPEDVEISFRSYAVGTNDSRVVVLMAGDGDSAGWFSEDGVDFQSIDVPFTRGSYVQQILPVEDGFVAPVFGNRPSLWNSPDGITWNEIDIPFTGWPMAVGVSKGRIVVVEDRSPQAAVWVADGPEGPWDEIPVEMDTTEGGSSWVNNAAVGDGGVAIAYTIEHGQGGVEPGLLSFDGSIPTSTKVLISDDLETWSTLDTGTFATGPEAWVERMLWIPGGLSVDVVSYDETGGQRVTLVGTRQQG